VNRLVVERLAYLAEKARESDRKKEKAGGQADGLMDNPKK
jgi:hypothetical protein